MFLDSTSKSLQIVLGSTVATNQLPVVTSWADISGSSLTPGSADMNTNGTTPVTIVAAPARAFNDKSKRLTSLTPTRRLPV